MGFKVEPSTAGTTYAAGLGSTQVSGFGFVYDFTASEILNNLSGTWRAMGTYNGYLGVVPYVRTA
jgi:hypothetical protein